MRYPILFIICLLNSPIATDTAAWADHGRAPDARATPAPPAPPAASQSGIRAGSAPAATDGATAACHERPWHCDVSPEHKQIALSLYREGNVLFDDSLFKAAADKYRAALEHWRHPGVYYNLMLCLVALDEPVDAYQYSLGALQYGALPLGASAHQRALQYHELLRGRVAVLEVISNEPGADVSLNGKLLFKGPGRVRRLVEPGLHELVARKPRYLPVHGTLTLVPDTPLRAQLTMLPEDQSTLPVRRWEEWRPWAIAGAGFGVGFVGAAFEMRARRLDDDNPGDRRALWHHRIGHGLAIAGAATVATGLVLALHNQPRRVDNPARGHLIRLSVAPEIGASAASVVATADF